MEVSAKPSVTMNAMGLDRSPSAMRRILIKTGPITGIGGISHSTELLLVTEALTEPMGSPLFASISQTYSNAVSNLPTIATEYPPPAAP